MFLGVLGFSALPFTPAWAGTRLLVSGSGMAAIPLVIIGLFFGGAHILLLIGYIRHFQRPIPPETGFVPWTRIIYPVGLLFLPFSHWLFFLWGSVPDWQSAPPAMWWVPLAVVGLGVAAWLLNRGDPLLLPQEANFRGGLNWGASFWGRLLRLGWLYRSLFFAYRQVGRVLRSISRLLEGDGGVLWALLFLLLLYSLGVSLFGGNLGI